MKTNHVPMSKRLLSLVVVVTLTLALSRTSSAFAVELNSNKGVKVNYVASTQDVVYPSSDSVKEINDLYQLKWYENPQRELTQAEFMLVQIRTIQASLERQNLKKIEVVGDTSPLNDLGLSNSVKRELLLCQGFGMIEQNIDGTNNWNITDTISRSEVKNMLPRLNYSFKISETPNDLTFDDISMDSSEPILVENMISFLNKEVGCHGIEKADVARAMMQTFKVTTPLNVSVPEPKQPAIVTDPALLPSNAYRYPYILDNVTKEEYEKPFKFDSGSNSWFYDPLRLYPLKKHEMQRVKEMIEAYYGFIFNVDYNTISLESLQSITKQYCCVIQDDTDKFNKYVNHVKENKIKTEATVQFLEPCLYYDTGGYRARVKVNYVIKETNTRKNVFFLDNSNVAYDRYNYDTNCIYFDIALANYYGDPNNYMYIIQSGLAFDIQDRETCGIDFGLVD